MNQHEQSAQMSLLDMSFQGRLGVMQVVMPKYREFLLQEMASVCTEGLHAFYGTSLDRNSVQLEKLDGVTLTRTKNRTFLPSPATLHWQDGLLDWLERTQPDALICEANPRLISTWQAIRWMRARSRPILGWGLGTLMLARGFESLRTFGRRQFLNQFDGMICYGTRARDEYAALGLNPERLHIAYNAAARRPVEDLGSAPAERIGGIPELLFVGRINSGKRIDLLIDAAIEAGKSIALKLTIIGNVDDALGERLRQRAAPLGDSVEFLPSLFGDQLVERYRAASVFVLPGLGGLAVQEAMCHGLPIIVAESDGTQFDLVDESNGWILPVDDCAALASCIVAALGDLPALADMGRASFARARDVFNVENAARLMVGAAITERNRLCC